MNGSQDSAMHWERIASVAVEEAQQWCLWLTPRVIAEIVDFLFFDTGAMYRAVTWAAGNSGIDLQDGVQVGRLAEELELDILPPRDIIRHGRNSVVLVNGQEVTAEIRRPEVDQRVSVVSAHGQVRTALSLKQRQIGDRYGVGDAEKAGVVMVGRDIGTVIMPDAALKIFLDASVEERARRRHREMMRQGKDVDFEQIRASIIQRDKIDSERAVAPLRPASDAVIIDTSDMGIEKVVENILKLVIKAGQGGGKYAPQSK